MEIAGIILGGIGVIAIIIGFIFIIPYKNVRQFSNNKVQGQIVDMVWDGAAFNAPRDRAANVEYYKVAGMEMQPGTRKRIAGDRATANMYHKVYRYVVNGREYLRADGVRYNKGAVQAQLGKQVNVYYNPQNPQESTLSNGKGYKITMIALFSAGGFFVLTGITIMILGAMFSSLI